MQKKILNGLLLALFLLFVHTACTSDVIEEPKQPDITDTISFSAKIQPIFNQNCAGCHASGGTPPNLTAGNAYQSLQSGNLFDILAPEQSEVYLRLISGGKPHIYKNATQAAIILTWIKQGALNN